MKIWVFIFTDPCCRLVSARVAANDRTAACLVMSQKVPDVQLRDHGSMARENGAILSFLGEDDRIDTAAIISAVNR